MQDFRIELIWAKVQVAITALGGWLGYFIGGMDGLKVRYVKSADGYEEVEA